MLKLKICVVLLYALLMVEARGPDPWDGEHAVKLSSNAKKNTDTPSTVNPLSDIFYKRILQLLINRGRFKVINYEFEIKQFTFKNIIFYFKCFVVAA